MSTMHVEGYVVVSVNGKRKLEHRLIMDHMECTVCRVVKPLTDFYRQRNRSSAYHPQCASCQKAKKKLTYVPRANEERIRKLAELDGELRTYKEWAADPKYGINYITLMSRIYRGMSLKEALTRPVIQASRRSQS